MSNEILDWSVIDYKSTVEHLLQQRGSKFRMCVMEDSYRGKSGAAVNQVGAVTAQARTTRHADTPLIETPHDKRWVFPTDYEWADLIDDQDKIRIIADPTSPYAINGAMALGRSMDDLIISAATATSLTGERDDLNGVPCWPDRLHDLWWPHGRQAARSHAVAYRR